MRGGVVERRDEDLNKRELQKVIQEVDERIAENKERAKKVNEMVVRIADEQQGEKVPIAVVYDESG